MILGVIMLGGNNFVFCVFDIVADVSVKRGYVQYTQYIVFR